MKQISLFIFALSLAACVNAGPHYEPAAASKIKRDVTTIAELELWFGKPHERHKLAGGDEKLVWQYMKGGHPPRTVEKYWLFVSAHADGRVKSFSQSWYVGNR